MHSPASRFNGCLQALISGAKTLRQRFVSTGGSEAGLIAEEGTMMISVLKWAILASITGVIVGSATAVFLWLLRSFIGFGDELLPGRAFLLLPLIMPVVVLLIRKLAPAAEGHGTEKVIEAVHKREGAIDAQVVPVKLLGTLLTLGAGGSVGKEGPAAQIGAGLAYSFAKILRLNSQDAKRLVICGISAGFAAVFGTPISGAIFGAEVLYLGLLQYDVMFPCLVAGVVAHLVCRTDSAVPAKLAVPHILTGSHLESILIALGSGVFFGLVALLFIKLLFAAEKLNHRIKLNRELKAALAGIVLIGVFFISPHSAGLGTASITQLLNGEHIPVFSSWWKMLATSVTLGFGGSGGIITPLFVVGSTAGFLLAHLTGGSAILLGAFGMVALVAAAANAPIAASVMALELFGPVIGTYAAIACCTAYLVVGHRSVYPSQILGATKSASIKTPELKVRVDELETLNVRPRSHGVLDMIGRITGNDLDKN